MRFPQTKEICFFVPINLLKPTGYVMHQQFYIQQLFALPTLYLCVLYLSVNKQRLVRFVFKGLITRILLLCASNNSDEELEMAKISRQ